MTFYLSIVFILVSLLFVGLALAGKMPGVKYSVGYPHYDDNLELISYLAIGKFIAIWALVFIIFYLGKAYGFLHGQLFESSLLFSAGIYIIPFLIKVLHIKSLVHQFKTSESPFLISKDLDPFPFWVAVYFYLIYACLLLVGGILDAYDPNSFQNIFFN